MGRALDWLRRGVDAGGGSSSPSPQRPSATAVKVSSGLVSTSRIFSWLALWGVAGVLGMSGVRAAELRFPPPDFESGYAMPATQYPAARAQGLEYLDVAVLAVSLGLAVWFIHRVRSRRGVLVLSMFSLLYFGFYREGCVCAIGSVQNVALAWFGEGYALPVGVGVFFAAPLLVALFFGRAFCAAVCPHGALQDLVLVKPLELPRWLESGLGVLPFLYLGAGVTFAATGAAFVICRYDPFVPMFRLSGGTGMLLFGGALLAAGMFIGRPYCRFLCPYGALLRVAGALSRWRVRITPDVCTQCRLCTGSCPYGVIREPDPGLSKPADIRLARRQVLIALGLLPILLVAGAWAGRTGGAAAAGLHPTVELAEVYAARLGPEALDRLANPQRLALTRAERQARDLVPRAMDLRSRFRTAGLWFGVWSGLVIGIKLISLGMVRKRGEYEPDRTGCFACARCFSSCPQERIRLGLAPASPPTGLAAPLAPAFAAPGTSGGSGGCGGGCGGSHP